MGWGVPTALALALLLGYLSARTPLMALSALLAAAALLALFLVPSAVWVMAATIAAITFRGLATAGLLPGLATYLDIVLAWGALIAALVQGAASTRVVLPRAHRHIVVGICLFAAAVLVSASLNTTEPIRPVFYLALIGEPFAIVGALLLQPPSGRMRKAVMLAIAALIAVQLPLVAGQFLKGGAGDAVQGTQFGSRAGAHLVGGLCILGLFWWVARARRPLGLAALPVTLMLAAVPFVAGAKQVIFALPAALLLFSRGARWGTKLLFVAAIVGSLAVLLAVPSLNEGYSVNSINQTLGGQGTKIDTARAIGKAMLDDPTVFFFGQGPANTVSHAAYLTTDPVVKESSPVELLGLKPSQVALDRPQEQGGGSFDSPASSGLGLLGDLGLIGAVLYAFLFSRVLSGCRASRSPEAFAASAGFAVLVVLGMVNDWFEQAPFTVPLAALAGLVLTAKQASPRQDKSPEVAVDDRQAGAGGRPELVPGASA